MFFLPFPWLTMVRIRLGSDKNCKFIWLSLFCFQSSAQTIDENNLISIQCNIIQIGISPRKLHSLFWDWKLFLDAIIQERIVFTLSVNMVECEVSQKFQKYQSDMSEQSDIKSTTFSTSMTLFTHWKLGALSLLNAKINPYPEEPWMPSQFFPFFPTLVV